MLKLLLGIGELLVGCLLCFDVLGMCFCEIGIWLDLYCLVCVLGVLFLGYIDYVVFCWGGFL